MRPWVQREKRSSAWTANWKTPERKTRPLSVHSRRNSGLTIRPEANAIAAEREKRISSQERELRKQIQEHGIKAGQLQAELESTQHHAKEAKEITDPGGHPY